MNFMIFQKMNFTATNILKYKLWHGFCKVISVTN